MEIRTVVVSRYPIFREGLKRFLGSNFVIVQYFANTQELVTNNIEAELAIIDEEASADLDFLRDKMSSLIILKLSLDDNTGCLYGTTWALSEIKLSAINGLVKKLSATGHKHEYSK